MMLSSLKLTFVMLAAALQVAAQATVIEQGVRQPAEEQIGNYKRLEELWRHPTFVMLRLASIAREFPHEDPTTTPRPYTIDEWLRFELFITQNSTETLIMSSGSTYRPELVRDGDVVSYSTSAQERVEREARPAKYGSASSKKLEPDREFRFTMIALEDWYESPLRPGHYQLIVRRQFVSDGDWAESNPVTFDVMSRKAAVPIPDGLSIRLVSERAAPPSKSEPYRVTSNDTIGNMVVNNSSVPVNIKVIDLFYGNRPELLKDGKPIPYLEAVAKQIQSKDSDPRLVERGDLEIDPKTTFNSGGWNLKYWYGSLPPGVYRLTNRRRFEIGGVWTKSSAELLIEIVR